MDRNINKYKKDYNKLVELGCALCNAMKYECYSEDFQKAVKKAFKEKASEYLKSLPDFKSSYQTWYSESKILIKQLLPDRIEDFIRYYENQKLEKKYLVKTIKLKIIYKVYQ